MDAGRRAPSFYLLATSIVSLLYVMENGASAEIAVVGNEGIVGGQGGGKRFTSVADLVR